MGEDGHRYTFGAPKGGWPSFSPRKGGPRSTEIIRSEQCKGQLELPLDEQEEINELG